ncbi:MAG: Acyl-CoA dehydrogenase domain-like [Rhizobacter sp.]|nr:Acyl-CoA dehydrogenase domain-like [Rhizobacter sp.]
MWHYVPPLRDMRFVMEDLLRLPAAWAHLPAFAELDMATASQVLEEAGRFAGEVLAPLNAVGDTQGCTLSNARVTTPAGFPKAYQAFVDGGWPALACDVETGGQGLPQVLNAALYEMLSSANHGWTMYPGLLHGAYECLHRHASPELKARYLAKIVSGEWLATMCLTEAQAGSDLGLITTRAVPAGDGSFRVTGTKVFISGGDHDLTDNIVHLVLARLPDAPAGTKGLSLLLVPSRLPAVNGSVGKRNAVRCDGIEKKMGIKGSATCVLGFEGAAGWLIGEPHRGLAAMFSMMNAARLHVGIQGLGHAEVAWQNALRYAGERLQMRAVARPSDAASVPNRSAANASTADPIVLHAAMRRSLLDQRVLVEGGRALALQAAHLLDVAEHSPDAAERALADQHASLLTPVVKAFLSDNGFAVASQALQVFGGYGYVHDYGMEQTLRDSRISMIYEGTNEIQAIDLLVRKVVPDGGRRFEALLSWLEEGLHHAVATGLSDGVAEAMAPDGAQPAPDTAQLGQWAQQSIDKLRGLTRRLVAASATDPELPHRAATDFLRLVGLTVFAQLWARTDAVAARLMQAAPASTSHASGGNASRADHDPAWLADKRSTARHCFSFIVPEADLRLALIESSLQPLAFITVPQP